MEKKCSFRTGKNKREGHTGYIYNVSEGLVEILESALRFYSIVDIKEYNKNVQELEKGLGYNLEDLYISIKKMEYLNKLLDEAKEKLSNKKLNKDVIISNIKIPIAEFAAIYGFEQMLIRAFSSKNSPELKNINKYYLEPFRVKIVDLKSNYKNNNIKNSKKFKTKYERKKEKIENANYKLDEFDKFLKELGKTE